MTTTLASGDPRDPYQLRGAFLIVEAALGASDLGEALLHRCQQWIADQLEERLGGMVSSLLPYVQANWTTVSAAHGGVPLLEFLTDQHLRDQLWAAISDGDEAPMEENQRSAAALQLVLEMVCNASAATSRGRALIERDLRNIRIDEREQTWLSGGEWD